MSSSSRRSRTRSKQPNGGGPPADHAEEPPPRISSSSARSHNNGQSARKEASQGEDPPSSKTGLRSNGIEANGTSKSERQQNDDGDDDGRSSSLSEIDDAPHDQPFENEPAKDDGVAQNDSEAETERLETTPQKARKHKAVVLAAGGQQVFERSPSKLSIDAHAADEQVEDSTAPRNGEDDSSSVESSKSNSDLVRTITAATSLEDSAGDSKGGHAAESTPSRKRKRGDAGANGVADGSDAGEPAAKKLVSVKDEHHTTPGIDSDVGEDVAMASAASDAASDDGSARQGHGPAPEEPNLGRARSTGKSKGRKAPRRRAMPELDARAEAGTDPDGQTEADGKAEGKEESPDADAVNDGSEEAAELDGEADAEEADADADADAGAAVKNEEELQKKRLAMDSLGTIEKQFATFRDRLYDERLSQLNHEMSLLTEADQAHAEYQAMLRCLDARRDEKIELEKTTLAYQLRSLQTRSVAERSQIHCQYFQTVRDLREKKLEEIGQHFYEIQRDRRTWDGAVPGSSSITRRRAKADQTDGGGAIDYSYQFQPRRSQLVHHQASYNLEVSVLSGVAKHVGFPAAPPVQGARQSEIEEDFRQMGIRLSPPR